MDGDVKRTTHLRAVREQGCCYKSTPGSTATWRRTALPCPTPSPSTGAQAHRYVRTRQSKHQLHLTRNKAQAHTHVYRPVAAPAVHVHWRGAPRASSGRAAAAASCMPRSCCKARHAHERTHAACRAAPRGAAGRRRARRAREQHGRLTTPCARWPWRAASWQPRARRAGSPRGWWCTWRAWRGTHHR